jgi:hypothetical protein
MVPTPVLEVLCLGTKDIFGCAQVNVMRAMPPGAVLVEDPGCTVSQCVRS